MPPVLIRAWATLHFLPAGSPFCCGEPGCHLGLEGDRLAEIEDQLGREMGLRQPVSLDLHDRVQVDYHDGILFDRAE